MTTEGIKQAVLALNADENPIVYSVEGNQLIGTWNWLNATFVEWGTISKENKEFKYTVTLLDNNKYKEHDNSISQSMSIGGGKISIGTSSFSGKAWGKSFGAGVGKNNLTGEVGVVEFDFDTNRIKNPIRELLKANGWKKKGLF